MNRTTVMLPDETLARLRQESRLRGVPVAEIVRDAVERHLAEPESREPRRLKFFAIGEGGGPPDASARADEYIWAAIRDRHADR